MTRKIRILQLIDQVGNAGAEMLLPTFAKGLDRARFEVHVCGLRPRPGSVSMPALRALGVPVVELNQRAAYDLPALLALVRYIRRQRIDLIHTHLQGADIMGRMAGFLTRTPVVSTIHNGLVDLNEEPPRRQRLERWTARLWCRRLVVVSELLREEVTGWFGLPPDRVITIANGVDTARFQRGPEFDRAAVKRALVGSDGPLISNVARLVPQKAQQYLIAATQIVAATRPDVRVALVGEGDQRAALEAQARTAGVTEQIIFAGFRANVADILAASEVFVLSSLWEGMPVALLEAMAAGCTAVVTDVGGVGQVVRHGETGFLVPPGDAAALAAALLDCVNDPERARRIGAAGQAWVEQEYGMRAWVGKLENLYLRELGIARPRDSRGNGR
jgi:glycosyltransferase involved in cell wall biosynthesis